MELLGAGVQDIALLLGCAAFTAGGCVLLQPAVAGGVVNGHAGLDVIAVDIEAHTLALVLHRHGLHLHSAGHQIVPLKDGGDPVENVVFRFLYVVGHQIFKGKHALHI